MKFLLWESRFETGVGEMDRRHRHEFEMINRVHKAVVEDNPRDRIEAEMALLIEDVEEHFRVEEDFMTRLRFPQADAHREEHEDLLNRLRQYKSEFVNGEMTPAYQFLELVHSWFIRHLEGPDKELGLYMGGQELPKD